MTAISIVAILLYWFPQPLVVGDYVIGGYPWLAPEGSKTAMIAIGVVISAVFLGLVAFMWYLSRRLEELSDYNSAEWGQSPSAEGGAESGLKW